MTAKKIRKLDVFEAWAEYVSLDLSKDAEGYYQSVATDMAMQAWFAAQVELPVEVQDNAEGEMMNDKIGNMPTPSTEHDALEEVRKIALDKRGHVLIQDHCNWLELKLEAVALMAERGLNAGKNPHTFGSIMHTALETISALPLEEQDNMMASNMRQVARTALACGHNAVMIGAAGIQSTES